MPEHDAFGRPIGDDPLAALREATTPPVEPVAHAEPVTAPEPVAPRPAASEPAAAEPPAAEPPAPEPPQFVRPSPRPRRRRRGVVILLAFAIVIVAAVPVVVGVVATGIRDEIEGVLPNAIEVGAPPVGLDRDSMIRRGNFTDALAILRDADLGRPAVMRVAPERIDATLVAGERVSQVQVRFDGELRRFTTNDTNAAPPTIPFDRIEPTAPERLVRRGGPRVGHSPRQIGYLVLTTGPGLPWGAYFEGGEIVQGDARGRPRRVL